MPGVPYGPLKAFGTIARVQLGRLKGQNLDTFKPNTLGGSLRLGIFRIHSAITAAFAVSIKPSIGDGLLEIIEWQMPLARRLSHCNGGKKGATEISLNQDSANDQTNSKQAKTTAHAGRFISHLGCLSDQLLQNQLPEPMLQAHGLQRQLGFCRGQRTVDPGQGPTQPGANWDAGQRNWPIPSSANPLAARPCQSDLAVGFPIGSSVP